MSWRLQNWTTRIFYSLDSIKTVVLVSLYLCVYKKKDSYYYLRVECFMVGLEDGYRIYNTDPLKENAREGLNSHLACLYLYI